ncbi:ABC transporter permease [Streptomyces sp. SID8352]|uniref:ABC transporter permease subunit n=1 Tax=Streptomyces sp. SID8352 TaxID=2690338 RepID=UPI0013692AA7|nr:ABC transporter permease subunit [Streptomyces sp. SID8352]
MTELAAPRTGAPVKPQGSLALAWRQLRRSRAFLVSGGFVVLIVLLAVAAPLVAWLTGHGPNEQFNETGLSEAGIPVGPGAEFWLGTDQLGRDVLVRAVYGSRVSLLVGVAASAVAVTIGVLVGTVAGYFRGAADAVLSRVIDVVMSLPFLLFAIALVSVVGPSVQISVAVIAFFSWGAIARVVRGQVLSIREREYIEAARSLGQSRMRIVLRDVLPNLTAPIVIYSTLMIPQAIVFESTLSFLGVGVVPPTPTWGGMLAEASGNSMYLVAWWLVLVPGLSLLATTVAFNVLGDCLRDVLDPRSRRTTKGN